jgi:hypothetical protein
MMPVRPDPNPRIPYSRNLLTITMLGINIHDILNFIRRVVAFTTAGSVARYAFISLIFRTVQVYESGRYCF